ncbi:MAG TPA: hypothetical protein VK797_17665 [Tepidisphaeraceae bacterium]|nr:hypothetical protein [Tepidisphaeraceae bacterium]
MVRALRTVIAGTLLISASSCVYTAAEPYAELAAEPVPQQSYPAPAPQPYTQWPIRVDSPSGVIEVYQPQPETFQGDRLTARTAISLQPPGAQEPVFGAMWMNARVLTDRDTRTVTIQDTEIKRIRFPDTTDDQQKQFEQILQQQIPQMHITFSLDELLTSLDVTQKEQVAVAQLQTTPPRILFTTVPATLVTIDGQPQLQAVEQLRVMRVMNSPFIILFDMDSRHYFARAGDIWFTASDIGGQWGQAGAVPQPVMDAASRLTGPAPQPVPAPQPGAAPPPFAAPIPQPRQLIVAEEPTELISCDGEPRFTPLPGNDLLYVSNTQSDVFLDVGTQQNFVLLSGRWYQARLLQGPWEYVSSDKLPVSFASISLSSPKAHVLASIAGTVEAKDAKLDASIPQTAVIQRSAPVDFNVAYDGSPQFESIQESPVTYAVNTPEAVLSVGNHFYCCHQAVWYDAPTPTGPWIVCTVVPQPIYAIPPSCPIYNVRYCYVYDYTPDVVYCGYLPGYLGCYIFGPTVVYGTGFYYHGWYHTWYYPRPWTFGCGARYDIRVSTWAYGAPYGWEDRWVVHDHDEHGWWGPRGYLSYRDLPRLRDSRPIEVRQTEIHNTFVNLNLYNRTENVRRNVTINRNVTVNRNETINRAEPKVNEGRGTYNPPTNRNPSTYQNNIYAGHDGQVYRRTDQGWEQRNRQGWTKMNEVPEARKAAPEEIRGRESSPPPQVERRGETPQRSAPQPEPPRRSEPQPSRNPPGLEADHVARQRGEERARPEPAPRNEPPPRNEGGSHGNNNTSGNNQNNSGRGK